ncbi:MAG: hypothetical protein LAO05_03820 [Acidobacteriia bacterium]|nr:hypothetical protein [Terriglobia bacterium]
MMRGSGQRLAESTGKATSDRVLSLFVALAIASVPIVARAVSIERASVTTSDGPRSFFLARPSRAAAGPRPLVIILHGHGGSAERALGHNGTPSPLSVWLAIADREEVVVAALDGAKGGDGRQGWNDCRADAPGNPKTDDVAFVRAVVVRLEREEGIDPRRIYAMGMSNGGFMAFRLALQLDPQLAAVAAVSSSMAAESLCGPPARAVSVIVIAGTADPIVPYGGGQVKLFGRSRGAAVSIEQVAAAWRHANGVPGPPVIEALPHLGGTKDPTRAVRAVWSAPGGSVQVELMRIDGGGHIEPSVSQRYGRLYQRLVGRQNYDFESAEEAWHFFRGKRANGASPP